jgi:hypothetical protein
VEAQSVRVTGSTSLRYVEVRPLVQDSVAVEGTDGSGLLRQSADGRIVRCIPGEPFCRGTRAGDAISTVPAVQDVEVSAWGFGEGVRLFSHLRGRGGWGERPDLWPRSDRPLEVLTAYGELDRDRYRVRAGRQWTVSGLGFYNFDGVSLAVQPTPRLGLDGYVGRSLVRGLNEPRTGGALEAFDGVGPESPGLLLGLQARARPTDALALSALYHLDVRTDRQGVHAELARADAVLRFRGGSVEGSAEVDVASAALNEARLVVRSPALHRTRLQGELHRYRPYFELWTIWGAFSPMGFDEGRMGVTWAEPRGTVLLRADASYRVYEDAYGAAGSFRSEGWGLSAGASWSPERQWRLESGARVETGFGGARSEGHAAVVRRLGRHGSVAARALAFQRVYEFRLNEGTVVGAGTEASLRLSSRTRAVGALSRYRHLQGPESAEADWNQTRGSLRLQWTVGPEPGGSGSRRGAGRGG